MVASLKKDMIRAAKELQDMFGIDPDLDMYERLKPDDFQVMMHQFDPDTVIRYIQRMEERRMRRRNV